MKRIGSILSVAILVSGFAVSARAADTDNVVENEEAVANYCHQQFQAIRPRTLATDTPEAKRWGGDIIDFYGPCDESPTGSDQVLRQRHDEEFRFGREYEDGE
jgi:hypothetical protein